MTPWWDWGPQARSMGAALDVHFYWYLEIRRRYASPVGYLDVFLRYDDGQGGYEEESFQAWGPEQATNELLIREVGEATEFLVNGESVKLVEREISFSWPWVPQAHALVLYGGAGYPERVWDLSPIIWRKDGVVIDQGDPYTAWTFTGNGEWDQPERIYTLPENAPAGWHGQFHRHFYGEPAVPGSAGGIGAGLAHTLDLGTGHNFVHYQSSQGVRQRRGALLDGLSSLPQSEVTDDVDDRPIAIMDIATRRFAYLHREGVAMVALSKRDGLAWEETDMAAVTPFAGYYLLDAALLRDGWTLVAALWSEESEALYVSRCTDGSGTEFSAPTQIAAGVTSRPVARLSEEPNGRLRLFYQVLDSTPQMLTNHHAGIEGPWT